jgi:uncharacterized phiE125 gp8 family phage protein
VDYIRIGHWGVAGVSTGTSTEEPVSVDDFRAHLRLEGDTDDVTLAGKLAAARGRIVQRTCRPFMRDEFDFGFDRYPCDGGPIRLPRWPLVSVASVKYYDALSVLQTMSSSQYFVDTISEPGRLCLNVGYTWPSSLRSHMAGLVRFTAGYTTNRAVGIPDPLLEAMRKLATELYENREAASIGNSVNEPLPFGVEELVAPYDLIEVG